jgi:hypothetical protein
MNDLEKNCREIYNKRGLNAAQLTNKNEDMIDSIQKTVNYFNRSTPNNSNYVRDVFICDKECQKERKLQRTFSL